MAFKTELAANLTENHEYSEVFIDSTYTTKSSRIELICAIASIKGVAFPLGYFFLGRSDVPMS